ncbi:MAG: hydantoinase/oxoprolinase N-terminal domain-containing protein [Burkholderiales bacterium]
MRDPLDFFDAKERPLVPRSHVIETAFRLDARGRVSIRPTREAIATLARSLRALNVDSVAIAITNAYLAPEVETAFAAALGRGSKGVSITTASGIWPEIREYERAMVGLMNAPISHR